MPKGIALCVGLNSVDPNHYCGWSGSLTPCEKDAKDIAEIAKSRGFNGFANGTPEMLLTKSATRKEVKDGIERAAKELNEGDIFLLYYSGHGGQLQDENMDEWDDCKDETWCLYDGELLDDELYEMWELFKPGVRIFVISDSCHSGTIIKESHAGDYASKLMPGDLAAAVYAEHKDFYDAILNAPGTKKRKDATINANIILLASCMDNQTSAAGYFNSLFTAKLKVVWDQGNFKGDHLKFHGSILRKMPSNQSPCFVTLGEPNKAFEQQSPFTI